MTKIHNEVKPLTTGQLAELYQINERTFKNWIEPHVKEIGEKRGNFYNITQVQIIFSKLGTPPSMQASH